MCVCVCVCVCHQVVSAQNDVYCWNFTTFTASLLKALSCLQYMCFFLSKMNYTTRRNSSFKITCILPATTTTCLKLYITYFVHSSSTLNLHTTFSLPTLKRACITFLFSSSTRDYTNTLLNDSSAGCSSLYSLAFHSLHSAAIPAFHILKIPSLFSCISKFL